MSPDQDNDVLTLALDELHLNKLRKMSKVVVVGTGRIMSDLASMAAIAHLKALEPTLHIAVEMDFAEVERRVLAAMEGSGIGFSPYSVKMLQAKFPTPEIEFHASTLKREPKHYEKFNKQRKKGRW